jgi:predicted flap endonuclease-1-like 5' DNA nuclease
VTPSSGGGPSEARSDRGRRRSGSEVDEQPPTLRDLPGVGATIERRLRESGLTSVADLADANEADLVERLMEVRGITPSKLHEWMVAARDMSTDAIATTEPDAPPQQVSMVERQESFVLTLSVDAVGNVQRSTIRHTRTGIEDTRPGRSTNHIEAFIASNAKLSSGATPVGQTSSDRSELDRSRAVEESIRLNFDGGHLIGGGQRSARISVEPPQVPWNAMEYDYDLVVSARQLGHSRWQPVGRIQGRATTGERLVADVASADLPQAIHRITLAGDVRAVADSPTDIESAGEASEVTA